MRSFRHWTLRYACDKARAIFYERTHPDAPWLTPDANEFLNVWLQPSHAGLEWGSGRSTVWIARRVGSLTTVESNASWHDRVREWLRENGLDKVTQLLVDGNSPDYAAVAERFAEASLDFALVDGVNATRGDCATRILPKIKPGGLCIIDDIQRFLPSNSRSPEALAPDTVPSPVWADLSEQLSAWKLVWTTNGIKDTAIWRKPDAKSPTEQATR